MTGVQLHRSAFTGPLKGHLDSTIQSIVENMHTPSIDLIAYSMLFNENPPSIGTDATVFWENKLSSVLWKGAIAACSVANYDFLNNKIPKIKGILIISTNMFVPELITYSKYTIYASIISSTLQKQRGRTSRGNSLVCRYGYSGCLINFYDLISVHEVFVFLHL